jgi:YD repeat-containing protein
MRRVLLALCALTTLVVVSCTKEKSFEEETGNSGGGGNSNGDLLAKIIIQIGPDSTTTTFEYDANKRLISEANKGQITFTSDDSLVRITRNSQGIIEKVEEFPNPILGDATVWFVRYNVTGKRYTDRLTKDANGNVVDSIAYTYDGSGKIVRQLWYVDFGGGFEELAKDTLIYDGAGNIKKVVTSEYDGTTWEELGEQTMEYDSKTNPLKLGTEAILLNRHQYYGDNNMTKATLIDYDMPSMSQEITLTYTYNASSKPASAAIGLPGAGGITFPATFRYK